MSAGMSGLKLGEYNFWVTCEDSWGTGNSIEYIICRILWHVICHIIYYDVFQGSVWLKRNPGDNDDR